MTYLLLHIVDREAFRLLGASLRDLVFDAISKIVIADYSKAVLNPNTPQDELFYVAEQMLIALNSRQLIYSQCTSLFGESFPSKGTMVFAFCFYVHRALGNTDRTDIDDVLIGKRDINDSNINDLPDLPVILQTTISIGATLTALCLSDDLNHLK